jgi:hypothetical protein
MLLRTKCNASLKSLSSNVLLASSAATDNFTSYGDSRMYVEQGEISALSAKAHRECAGGADTKIRPHERRPRR